MAKLPIPPHSLGLPAERKIKLGISTVPVDSSDRFLFHKTTSRQIYLRAMESCRGCDDVILSNERGEITESTIGNLVIEIDGRLLTPRLECGLLPGVFRERVALKRY